MSAMLTFLPVLWVVSCQLLTKRRTYDQAVRSSRHLRGASFGMGPSGKMKTIYKRDFTREFINADAARMSFNDRYVFIQWGFFFSCTCTLTTDKGDITIR